MSLTWKLFLLAVAMAQTAQAHIAFTDFFVDGHPQGDGTCVRMSNNIPQATYPLPDITAREMACGT